MTALTAELSRALAGELAAAVPLAVAFSGGRDSSVLLHALAALRADYPALRLRALHVEHDLQPAAPAWAAHCAQFCAQLAVPFAHLRVQVPRAAGRGLEAAARTVRYAALRAALQTGECLLTAHHAGDQLETLLMHLRRGSGVDGMAGIPARSDFPPGTLLRPLLGVAPASIEDWAVAAGIRYIEDPSNLDPAVDRSYLRGTVVRALSGRWPDFAAGAAASARRLAEAASLLDALAAGDAQACQVERGRIELAAFAALEPARQRLLLRFLCRREGLALPPRSTLEAGLPMLLAAAWDRNPRLDWPGGELRRWRGRLYLAAPLPVPRAAPGNLLLRLDAPLQLGPPRGQLRLRPAAGAAGLAGALAAGGLAVRFRAGGESLRPAGDAHQRTLKQLWQGFGLVPWMRGHVPLLYAGNRLVAVADLWLAADACAAPGEAAFAVEWRDHAPLR